MIIKFGKVRRHNLSNLSMSQNQQSSHQEKEIFDNYILVMEMMTLKELVSLR